MQATGSAWERLHVATTSSHDIREADKLIKKKLCCYFIVAVGVMTACGGFLANHVVQKFHTNNARAAELRARQNNAKYANRSVQNDFVHNLDAMSGNIEYRDAPGPLDLWEQGIDRTGYIFSDLEVFKLRVNETVDRMTASICGYPEKDRLVVISASGHGRDIAINIAKAMNQLHKKGSWRPKRSWVFCLFYGSKDRCAEAFREDSQHKIVGYVAIHGDMHGTRSAGVLRDQIHVLGSGVQQSTVVDAVNETEAFYVGTYGPEVRADIVTDSLPRLPIGIPHVLLKHSRGTSAKSTDDMLRDQKILTRIVALAMWSLSESLFFRWDPRTFNDTMHQALEIVPKEARREKDALKNTITKLTDSVIDFNYHLDKQVDKLNDFEVRQYNDKLLDFERAMFCSDQFSRSQTDIARFKNFSSQSIDQVKSTLKDIRNCFVLANRIIRDKDLCNILS
ncbi:hypothetical protein TKK_0012019 [Trichogramma kaykai]|uniref:Transferrin receptor-like dimerisation domain-containing protein n=1 Tax=Trichogramma kaykai TaxID=54128 RepID=A0ABD2WPB0_9HYME